MAETVTFHIVNVTVQTFVVGDNGAQLVNNFAYNKHFTEGSSSNQVGSVWVDPDRALDTAAEDLQLDNLSDFQGSASAFNNIKVMLFHNQSTTPAELLTLGGSGNGNEWDSGPFVATGDKVRLGPSGLCLIVNPIDAYPITAGDDLGVEASATQVYDVILSGDH